jgi:thioesterase domain-containing protein
MLQSSNVWIEFMRFACEVQSVVLMRLVRLSQGGPGAGLEAQRMVAEKFDALAEAEAAMADAFAHGEVPMVAAERAYAPVRERVHANNCRLMATAA